MKEYKLRCGLRNVGNYSLCPSEELKILHDLLTRFISQEKYELAAIVRNRIEILTSSPGSSLFNN